MGTYEVTFTETWERTVRVEAENEERAWELAASGGQDEGEMVFLQNEGSEVRELRKGR